jgi:uncharacterized protein YkwD
MPRIRALLLPALTAVALGAPSTAAAAAAPCANANLKPSPANLGKVRSATLCLINRERAKHGLGKLRRQRTLDGVARRYSRQMVRHRFFSHVSPAGSTMTQRVRRSPYLRGVRGWSLGENLAWGSGTRATPRETVRAWMHSPGHRRNILDRGFREIGIGIVTGAPVSASGVAATYTTNFGHRR